jgi:RNA polymerase sigma-70 factor, ECF subfamily
MNGVEVQGDGALVDAMRRGDEQAFAELYERHHPPLYRYALHMCGAAAADDVVQETFTALLRDHGFDPRKGTLRAYLFGIARYHILRRVEIARAELPLDEEATLDAASDSPFEDVTRAEAVAAVRAAIATLPAVYREAIVLCELEDLPYAAAAEVLGVPLGTVRSRLHRARALLHVKLRAAAPVGNR